jgi:hypothetical protein
MLYYFVCRKSAKGPAETNFYRTSFGQSPQETKDFALNRITYDNEVLLIDSVKRTRVFERK